MSRRYALVAALVIVVLTSPGCVERHFVIESDPPNAIVYMNGKYLLTGAQYVAPAISGKSFEDAVPYMTSGTNPTSREAEAAAGYLIGEILAITHDQPASVAAQVPASLKGISTSSVTGSQGNSSSSKTTPTTKASSGATSKKS